MLHNSEMQYVSAKYQPSVRYLCSLPGPVTQLLINGSTLYPTFLPKFKRFFTTKLCEIMRFFPPINQNAVVFSRTFRPKHVQTPHQNKWSAILHITSTKVVSLSLNSKTACKMLRLTPESFHIFIRLPNTVKGRNLGDMMMWYFLQEPHL